MNANARNSQANCRRKWSKIPAQALEGEPLCHAAQRSPMDLGRYQELVVRLQAPSDRHI